MLFDFRSSKGPKYSYLADIYNYVQLVHKQQLRYRKKLSMLHAASSCPCCRIMSTLNLMSMLNVHAAYPWYIIMLHRHAHAACPHCASLFHVNAVCPCSISALHGHAEWTCSWMKRWNKHTFTHWMHTTEPAGCSVLHYCVFIRHTWSTLPVFK